jgi:hypothetical protein
MAEDAHGFSRYRRDFRKGFDEHARRVRAEDQMVRAVLMTPEQVSELVELARADSALWEELKDRELEIEKALADARKQGLDMDDRKAVLDPPKLPTMGMLVSDIIKRRYGPNENFDHGSLKMAVRRRARIDLGLPV